MLHFALTSIKRNFVLVPLLFALELSAQSNLVNNYGFEASSSAATNWTTSTHAGTSGIVTSGSRSGANAYTNTSTSRTTTGYVENSASITVPNNQYLILIGHYKVNGNASSSRVHIGVSSNMGTAYTPAGNNTYYQVSRAIQNTSGSTATWSPRINMYLSTGSTSRVFTWDDIIAYLSTTSTIDLTNPNSATNASVNYTSSSATLTWTNGADNSGGSGVQRTVVLRMTGTCPGTAPTLAAQTIYSKSGGYGVSTIGSWTVLDTVTAGTTSYTDNTISAGTSYVYALVHEDKAYNHSTGTLLYVPVSATTSPTSPTNTQTGVAATGTSLSWPSICGAASYDVYLGTNQTDVNNQSSSVLVASSTTATSYNAPTLSYSTTYYWKVVPKNAAGNAATGCPTWSFTSTIEPLSFEITRSTGNTYSSILTSGNSFSWGSYYNADDQMSDALDLNTIGFTGFSYQGMAITALKANTNGFITFNSSSSASFTNSFASQSQIIAPFWEDLVCQGYIYTADQSAQLALLQGSMKYLVTGPQGNQVLTIEWSEMEIYNNPGPSLNFQIKLYEQDDRIEFVYGRMYGFNGTINYIYSYSLGLSAQTVASTPTSGQLVAQQIANVRNFSTNNATTLSELPDCNSKLTFVPNQSPSSASESARSITNDACSAATTLPIHNGILNDFCNIYSSAGATASASIPVCTASTPGTPDDDVWFKFTVTTPGNYGITVNASGGYDAVVQLFSGNCNALTAVSCANSTSVGAIETITASSLVEGTYFVRVYDAATGTGGSGNFVVSVYSIVTPPTNDNCSGAVALTIGTTYSSGSTANATASSGIATCGASSPGTADDDVWFTFTATSTITRIAVDGGIAYNAVMQYFSGSCSTLTNLGCVSSTGAAGEELEDITTTIGTTYFVRVYHSANGATPTSGFSITISNPVPSCPTLSSPANGVTNINRTTTQAFSWSAATLPSVGTKTYTIQISTTPTFSSLITLTGATGITTTSYTLAANTLSANTQYYWRVLAVNSNGTSSGCSYNAFATTGGTSPSCASGLTPTTGSTGTSTGLTLSWTAGAGSPTSYDVYLSATQSQVTGLNSAARVATSTTSTSYTASGLSNGTTYYWTVIPKNASGSASGCYVATFTTIAATPANDNCSGAITLSATSSTPISGTTLNATQSMAGTVGTANDDVWYKFTAVSAAHNIQVSPEYSFNAVVELFSGSCGSLTSISCVNANGNGEAESISATGLTVGQTYYVRVYDFGSVDPTSFLFDISINDIDLGVSSFASPTANTCGNTTVTVNLTNYSTADINFSVNPVTVSGSVLSPANVTTTFTNVVINSGTLASGATRQVTLTTDYSVINAGSYTYSATATTANDNNNTNNSNSAVLQRIELPSPFILTGTGSYCAGGSGVTFTLSGSETGVNYQLYRSSTVASSLMSGNGSPITFSNVTVDGSYRVVATSTSTNCNSYMSASAVVTVNPLWLGFTSDWNTASNWCGNVVPPSNANIVISGSAVNMPVLPGGTITVNNLDLSESNKSIDLNGSTLTINGQISGSGVIKGSTASSIVVNGSGDIGALKMDQTANGSTNALRNLTVNIGTGSVTDLVTLNNTLNLTGTLTLSNGTLATGGNLVLVSNASGTARISAIASTADITGNVTSQRYVPAVVRRYRMLSPNTSSFTYNDIKDDIYVTGSGGATNGFDASNPNSASIYTYQESTTGGRGWKAVTNITQTLSSGRGAIVFVRGDRTLAAPQWYTPPYVSQNAVTLDFVGPVNKGNISPSLTYTNTGDADNDGFNLIGNPYPSQIDWTLVTKSNLNPFIYILNPSTNGYVANDGSTPIASGQAFFVQANAASPTVTFTESCKTSGAATSLFKTSNAPFTLTMTLDSINSDLAVLRFRSGTSVGFSAQEDALKFSNSSINMGFKVSGKDVQINTIPQLSAVADTFVLFTNAPANTYRISASNFNDIPATKDILLVDQFTNTVVNLRQIGNYQFTTSSNAASQGTRFLLVITSQGSLPVEFVDVKAIVAPNESDVMVSWATATEVNNEKFVVEKSYDNITFKAVGSVKGAVNSKVRNDYIYTDMFAATESTRGRNSRLYYRIRQVDLSGDNRLSKTVVIDFGRDPLAEATTALQVYPNPAKSYTEIKSGLQDALGTLIITDVAGQEVMQVTSMENKVVIDVSKLKSGVYFVKGNGFEAQKLIVE